MAIKVKTRSESFEGLKADYQAAKVGRFRRRRTGLTTTGSGADYHYRSEADYLRIIEYARDMDRNDAVVGQMVDRAVLNIVQNGLLPDPKTGDPALNQALKDRWWAWASDARQCSADGELVYRDLEKLALRTMFVDGDNFTLPLDEGTLQVVEAHRCRTPGRTQRNVVHGIFLDEKRRRLQYWFTKEDIDPWRSVALVSEMEKVEAFDAEQNRNVLHLRNPKRPTQTRGVSAFAPIFDMLGFHEDLQFSKLVQQQVASCIAILRQRSADWKAGGVDPYGQQTVETFDAQKRIVEELAPGMEIRGLPGEEIKGFSPTIPNAEFFQQMRTILQLIGVNLGMPLVLLLMDASDTNFSGWRGAMDQARMGFRDMQQHLIDHWECPVYLWKLRQFAREDRALRTAMESKAGKVDYFAHEWNAPRWPYVQPYQDAQADQLRQRALLASPRRIHGGLAQDWNDTIVETLEDNAFAIGGAIAKAQELSKTTGERITWRELLFLTDPEMHQSATASVATAGTAPAGPLGLNGAQITAAVDIVGKLHAGSIAATAAKALLVAVGIEDLSAAAIVAATPTSGGGDEDKQFARTLLTAFAANPNVLPLVVNGVNVGGVIKLAGAPQNPAYDEPYLPVLAPPGNPVSGDVLKDPQGDIVGGAVVGTETPNAKGQTPNQTGGAGGPAAPREKPGATPPPPADDSAEENKESA